MQNPFCRKLLFAGFLVPLCPKRAANSFFFLCILLFLLLNLFEMLFALFAGSSVRVGSLRLFWGMVVRGCARRDLC